MKIILASKSIRRKQLLNKVGIEFKIVNSKLNESLIPISAPKQYCQKLAILKAKSVLKKYPEDLILAADTIVCIDDTILEKPINYDDAFNMLKLLSGRTHNVYTGVSILSKKIDLNFVEKTEVTFFDLLDHEIKFYIETNSPYDKSGSYGIQDGSFLFVEKIKGSYENVIGLPISKVYRLLLELKVVNKYK